MDYGKTLLGRRHVLPGVAPRLHQIQVEGTFPDGSVHHYPIWSFSDRLISVFLVTVHDPICTDNGDIAASLYGSFLPAPPNDMFPAPDPASNDPANLPGAIIAKKERIVINRGRERIRIRVTNNGDRPIQVTQHVNMSPLDIHQHRLAHTTTFPKRTGHLRSIG